MRFTRWRVAEIAVGFIACLLIFIGSQFSRSALYYGGTACFGATWMLLGFDGAINRRVVLPSRYRHGRSETYLSMAAVAWGVLLLLWGLFFIGVSFLAYTATGRSAFLYFVRRPGAPLLLFALTCGMTAVHAIMGSVEEKQGPRWELTLNLIASRLLPGLMLVAIALGAASLGLLEVFAPESFDQMGGGFLEVLFGVR